MDFDASMVGENNDRAMRPLNRLVFFFFNQDTAFYTVGARQSHDMCLDAYFLIMNSKRFS